MKPSTTEARQLFLEGSKLFSRMEANGIKVDQNYLRKTRKQAKKRIQAITEEMRQTEEWRLWKRQFGERANMTSGDQLGVLLFDVLKLPGGKKTEGGKKYSTDAEVLINIDNKFVKLYLQLAKYNKINGTFLSCIQREVEPDGLLHAVFNLHTTVSFRSSMTEPNMQNLPIRDPEMGKYIRQCFIPRGSDRVLVETDFSGIEVRIAACYHKDPTMLTYINDKTKDMHRDMSAQIYCCKPEEVSKSMRYCAKNQFVFPQFYGDYYINCSRSMYDSIVKMNLVMPDGTPLDKHLAAKGIRSRGACDPQQDPKPGTFESHVKKIEKHFWKVRFPVYTDWKERWFSRYKELGWFQMKTGFTCAGVFDRKQVINWPVQGAAFHCLLWSAIEIQKQVRKQKLDALLVNQIHDSLIADVHVRDVDDYLQLCKQVMTKKLVRTWRWIITPLEIEAEVTNPGESWFTKKEIAIE